MTSEEISVVYSDSGCRPLESFVPVGKEIKVNFENATKEKSKWVILIPVPDPSENYQEIYFSITANPGKTTTSSFFAPDLPARYETLCFQIDQPEKAILKYLLVIEPR